ncbi:hypothetical protein CDO73_09385 [Saccharibacillus sp. O23]|uniref:hypothetical protein n=1 Tax=Saccharibacillus sp. O23 TaxID=2009338 RepID=UPI000B4E8188|nr:hypothetical protein [Saccharibacillus sp. O23]OWR30793.1 hypothetical protein CDO73_09385 [Saccharibacillus sp. O23]
MSGSKKKPLHLLGDFQVGPEERWRRYLHERHSPEELREWAHTLRYLRYRRATGGHAGDGDRLLAAVAVGSRSELESVCGLLGIELQPIREGEPDWPRQVRSLDYPDVLQPGNAKIGGVEAFAWIYSDRLEIGVSDPDNPYEVSASTVEAAAEHLEPLLAPLQERLIDPPNDNRNCICPKYYPELFED